MNHGEEFLFIRNENCLSDFVIKPSHLFIASRPVGSLHLSIKV